MGSEGTWSWTLPFAVFISSVTTSNIHPPIAILTRDGAYTTESWSQAIVLVLCLLSLLRFFILGGEYLFDFFVYGWVCIRLIAIRTATLAQHLIPLLVSLLQIRTESLSRSRLYSCDDNHCFLDARTPRSDRSSRQMARRRV